ncbi:ferredoxin [Streptomyces sp. NPDC054796]
MGDAENPVGDAETTVGDTGIRVDRDRCMGSGQCTLFLPGVFDQSDDDGKVVLLDTAATDPAPAAALRTAVMRCPSGAISLRPRDSGVTA